MIIYSERYLEHNLEYYPENSNRLKAVMKLLTKKDVFEKVPLVEPTYAKKEDILRVHTPEHFEFIKHLSEKGEATIGADTYVNSKSFDTAMLSSGGIISCVDKYFEGYKYSFALIRPPGHHAETNRSMGFCLFNNIAVGAKYAMEKYGLKKIFVLDYDVHHGNGTQEIFYSSKNVLYLSLHQYPLYPGTGSTREMGKDEGRGYTINVPLPQKTCDKSYLRVFDEVVIPVMKEFRPELILVSAGYDAHHSDPLGGMRLSSRCYYEIAKKLKLGTKAGIIFGLEGGYNTDALANSVFATLAALFELGEEPAEMPLEENKKITSYVDSRIAAVKKNLSSYWSFRI
ncbi:MAG: histone deacetylase [Candidatus Hydrothermarchaeota archaeon]|nr:histone deacetylase [Candidatus Hydrothermarchaeota archaeon]